MDIQQTVVDLFQEKRIDKSTAYRLLAEIKKGAAAPTDIKLGCRLERHAADDHGEIEALTAWVYLVHIVSGQSELALDYLLPDRRVTLRLQINDQLTPAQVRHDIAAQLGSEPADGDVSPFAWLAPGAYDTQPRRLAVIRLPAAADDPAAIRLELRAQPNAQGATRAADWPDTLQHFYLVMWNNPDTPFAELDRLPARHRRLLAEYNAAAVYLPPARTLPGLLDPELALEQDMPAVQTSTASLSYRAYKQRAYRLAHLLRKLGAKRNDRVAVVLHRTVNMPAALYGVVCSGAAYVPLEPDMPADRIQAILRDTGAAIVVTDADTLYAEQMPFGDCGLKQIVCIDAWPRGRYQGLPVSDASAIQGGSDQPPGVVNQPEDLCYVIYTSGSTGRPKGVMISHLNLINTLIGVNNVFNVGAEDRILCFSSYGFDLSVWDIFGAALACATVFVPTKAEIRDPSALLRILRDHAITIWDSVPTGMSQLLQPLADREVAPVQSLRLALLSGEFIQPGLPAELHRVFPHCRLANMGGATEGTVWSIHHYPVERFEPHWKSIPYGKPLPNQRFYVLNESLKHCAIGEKGMLYIGGLGVAQGYLGDEERTRRAFIPAPWKGEPGGRIYRTGDLGIMRADGVIEITGRADHQVKVRGFRVELGEIESQFGSLDGIDQAAVIAKRDESNQYRLVAFYVSRRGEIGADELRAQLAHKLPEYMLPSQFVYLADPPVGQTGKLDRKALESREVSRNEMGQEYVKPSGETEEKLAAELARILRLDRVGVDDDFFLIGGDSLLALQYLSVLSQLGFSASPLDIQQGRTIRGVLARVSAEHAADAAPQTDLAPFGPMPRKFFERLPLVDRDHWNQMMVIGFDHRPDLARLRQAMLAVINHHPLLRASYEPGGLRVAPRSSFELPILDLSGVPFFLRRARYLEQVARMHASVGLNSASLANAMLVCLSPTDVRLIWVLHHLVVDANCWRILVDDLATSYRQPGSRLLRSASYADFVAMVREGAGEAGRAMAQLPRYERMPLPGQPPVAQPPDTGLERDGRTVRLILSPQETKQLFQVIRQNSAVNLNLMLLTALSMALRQWADRQTVRFDVISNGRSVDPALDLSRAIGWFATHNPFQVNVPDAPREALAEVTAAWRDYQDNSRFFVEVCNDVRGQAGHPLGHHVDQALLYSFLGDFDSIDMPDGWNILGTAGRNRGVANPRTHELEMEAMVARGCLMLRLVCGKRLAERRMANRLLSHFRAALTLLVKDLAG